MAGGSGPALGGAEEAGAGTAGRTRGAGGGGGAPEPPPRVNAGFLLFGEVRARGGAGCRPGPLAVSGGCPLECVRVEAETNLGSRASECACGGFALALPLPAEDPDPSEPPPRLLGRVTARQRCYLDCEEGDVGSLQTNVGPDGAEAFCYEEFSVDRWVRAEGDFFKRVDFNLSESAPPPAPRGHLPFPNGGSRCGPARPSVRAARGLLGLVPCPARPGNPAGVDNGPVLPLDPPIPGVPLRLRRHDRKI